MLLELIGILNKNGATMNFDQRLQFDDLEFNGVAYHFALPMHCVGTVENISGSIELRARVEGKAQTSCARCGKPLEVAVSYDFVERICSGEAEAGDEDDVTVIEGSAVNLSDVALNHFLMQAPMRYLCKPDCKGLCQYCGADRNVIECDCADKKTDPRMEVLDQLFKD